MADVNNKWSGENPWLGLGSYSEGQKLYGRDREIEALTEIIYNHPAIVLYGKSGIGKSSLLRAGVFPQIRQDAMVPVYIRLTHNSETSYARQIETAISEKVTIYDKLPSSVPDLGLWDFMHRHRFADSNGEAVTPVIVLDQFEEIFTLTDADHKGEIQKLFTELADVLNDIKPDKVIQAEASQKKTAEPKPANQSTGFIIHATSRKATLNYDPSPSFKFVFSIRDDSLYLLERNCAKIPALKINRFNLNALDEENALTVITKPRPGLFSDKEAKKIIDSLAYYEYDDYRVVDPAILSLFLFSYFREQGKISYDDIFERYYHENTQSKHIKESSISYIEDNLLTERGNRNQVPLEDIYAAGISPREIKRLLDSKILKTEKRKGTKYVEFSHDRLCEQAHKHRQERKSKEQARKMRKRLLFVCLCSLASIAALAIIFLQSRTNNNLQQNNNNLQLQLSNKSNEEIEKILDQIDKRFKYISSEYDTIQSMQDTLHLSLYNQHLKEKLEKIEGRRKEIEKENTILSDMWKRYLGNYKKWILDPQVSSEQYEKKDQNNNESTIIPDVPSTQSNKLSQTQSLANDYLQHIKVEDWNWQIASPERIPSINNTKKETSTNTADNTSTKTVPTPKKVLQQSKLESNSGLCISKHQGSIDWSVVSKESKIKFVYIKATEGSNLVDPKYTTNITNARKNKIKTGSYHFFTCRSSATSQFENFKNHVDKKKQDLIPVIDVETCNNNYTPQQLRDSLKVFINLFEKHYGTKPMIYSSETFFRRYLGRAFSEYPLFIAKYSSNQPNIDGYNWVLWEYSERGRVKGINNAVNFVRFNKGCSIKNINYK